MLITTSSISDVVCFLVAINSLIAFVAAQGRVHLLNGLVLVFLGFRSDSAGRHARAIKTIKVAGHLLPPQKLCLLPSPWVKR